MLIFHPQYRAYYKQASQEYRRKILHAVLLACGFMLIVIGDYTLVKTGYVNQIESYPISFAEHNSSYFNQFSRAYLIYDHQNILNYLKNIQYVLWSLDLAMCSLLLNSRKRGPYLERFGLISDSVFATLSILFFIVIYLVL